MTVTKGGISKAVEKYGIASVIQRNTISSNSDIHLLAAGSFGVINGIARETVNTDKEMNKPCARTAGNMSSDDFIDCSVAKRSVSIIYCGVEMSYFTGIHFIELIGKISN